MQPKKEIRDRKERLNKAPHFLYHCDMKKHNDCSVHAAVGRATEPEKKHIFVVRSL
jgi:hypothetical protein